MRDRLLERRFERFRRKGDVAALGKVFDGAAPELLRVATNLATGLSEAEDLVQATFLTAIERASSWDRGARLMPWLLGILVRHAHEARRQKSREHGEPPAEGATSEGGPRARAEAAELSESVRHALRTIPEPYRGVLQPFLVEGRGATEIARATGRAPGTVRMQIHRGLERLRRALPAGLGAALALRVDTGRGLAAMRAELVAHASASPTVLAAASATTAATSLFGTSLSVTGIGSLTLVKNLALATVAVALAAGVAWIAWPDAPSNEPVRVAPSAGAEELGRPTAPEPEPAQPSLDAPAVELPSVQRREARAADPLTTGSLYERSLAGVRGRLLTHRGEPVANTEVTLLEFHPGMFLRAHAALASGEPPAMEIEAQSARTDGEGRFRLHGVRTSGLHAMGVDLGGPRGTIVFLEHVLNSGQTVALGDVVLAPAGRLSGRVVDETGRPVAGARVRAAEWPEWIDLLGLREWRADAAFAMANGERFTVIELPAWVHAWEPRLPIPTAITGKDGRFALESVRAGTVAPMVDRDGRPACTQPLVRVAAGVDHDAGDLVLAAGRRVAGHVVDGAGASLAGIEVRAGVVPPGLQQRFPLGAVLRPAVRTDSEGRFAVEGLPLEGAVLVAARRAPGLAWRFEGPYDPARGDVELAFAADVELTLELSAPDGEPVSGAEVAIGPSGPLTDRDAPPGLSPLRPVPELEEPRPGVLRLSGLAPGPHQARVTADGFASAAFELELEPGANEKALRLAPARVLKVRVVDDESGAPLTRCSVSVHVADTRGPALEGGVTDARGEVVLAQVPTGDAPELLLRVEHPGFALQRAPLAPDVRELEVRMTLGGSVLARVQRAGLPPAEPVFLEFEGRLVKGFDLLVCGNCDAEGCVSVERLMAGEYRYRVYERHLEQGGFGLVDSFAERPEPLADGHFTIADGECTQLEIDLSTESGVPAALACAVSGRLTLDGKPLAGVEMMLISLGGPPVRDAQRQSSKDGQYEYADLAPGEYYLVFMNAGQRAKELGTTFQHLEQFELAPGERRLFGPDWRPREVEVYARSEDDGRALEGVRVMLHVRDGKERATTTGGVTDSSGVARVLTFRAGEYRLDADHPELGVGRATGTLAAGDDRLEVEVSGGVPCVGLVRIPPGTELREDKEAVLTVAKPEGGSLRQARVRFEGGSGAFRVTGLQPGSYSARLHETGAEFQPLELALPEGGSETLELEFVATGAPSQIRAR